MALYKVGTIVNTHGIRGEVRVIATTDFPEERFVKGKQLVVKAEKDVPVTVQTVRQHKQFWLLSFKDLQNINLIEQYKGCELMVAEDQLTDLAEDEFYYHEIIGLDVVNNADGAVIGTVSEIMEMPANDVWVVKRANQKPLYIPYIASVVTEIDLEAGQAKINLLEGLE